MTDLDARPVILAVDDEPRNLLLVQRLLGSVYRVVCSPNGATALAILEQTRVDLVLMDIMMPEMDGYQVIRRMRQEMGLTEIPIILVSALADAHDVATGLSAGANDYITKPFDVDVMLARVQTQVALKQLQDERKAVIANLEAAQEMRDRLLRIASHDLKGPLTNIVMLSALFRRFEERVPEAGELMDALDESVDSMRMVIEDFLDTAAMNTQQIAIKLEAVSLDKVLHSLLTLYQPHAAKKDIHIDAADGTAVIQADAARFQQALGNLISNAVKYSPLHTMVRVWSEANGEMVTVAVADQGPGIPEGERSRLFTPFGKLSPRPTAGEHSTGLGLWIVKHLIQLQGGEVGVECPAEGGSVFWIRMPKG
ncbi:MAG: hybrid sensor histidine kinase/response regulator [Anaerolineae bacterium]|nr:hybrid sensor histidine kinase/response regulator [Anaerolineae bacterium]